MAPRGGASLGRPGHPRLCALCPVAGRSPTRIPSPEQQGPWWPSLRADPAQPGRPRVPCHAGAAAAQAVTTEGAALSLSLTCLAPESAGDDGERESPVTEAASSPRCAGDLRKPRRSALRASEARVTGPLGPRHVPAAETHLPPSPEAGRPSTPSPGAAVRGPGRFHGRGVGGSAPPSTESLYAPYFDHCRPQHEGGGRSGAGSDGVDSSPCPSPAPSGSSGRRGVRSPEPRSPLLCGGQCVPTSPRGSAADGARRARPESGRVPLPGCFSSRPQFSFTAQK